MAGAADLHVEALLGGQERMVRLHHRDHVIHGPALDCVHGRRRREAYTCRCTGCSGVPVVDLGLSTETASRACIRSRIDPAKGHGNHF